MGGESVILSEERSDESKDPLVSPQISAGVGCPVQAQLERGVSGEAANPPDRVPLPEDELAALKMTRAEKMEFFSYSLQFPAIEHQDELKMHWLRAKRSGQLYKTQEDRLNNEAYEAMFPELPLSAEQDAA